MDILYDSDLECEDEIDLGTVNSVVQPYMYEPTPHQREPPCSSESSSDGDIDEEQEEIPTEPSEWCKCDRCGPMPTQRECKCCQTTNIVDSKVEAGHLRCITEHSAFIANCLNIEVLEVAYYAYIQENGLQPRPIHETYRYVAYRQFARWIYKILPKKDRRILPSCVVTTIRNQFPSEQYTGFKYPE